MTSIDSTTTFATAQAEYGKAQAAENAAARLAADQRAKGSDTIIKRTRRHPRQRPPKEPQPRYRLQRLPAGGGMDVVV